jgi:hypothetical protein
MPRCRDRLVLLGALALGFGAFVPAGLLAQEGATAPDSSREALEKELEAYLRELEGLPPDDDPFAAGLAPDLLVLSTADVRGEVAPCG